MIRVTPNLSIDESLIQIDFICSSGPGGQNVNKVATAAQLRFDVARADLDAALKARLVRLAGTKMSGEGVLIIDARRHRSQKMNRDDALARLVELLARAAAVPKRRRATRPTFASRQRRLESKKRRSDIKRLRRDEA